MSTKKFDPEKYLTFHFGRKEHYPRLATITAMSGFLQTSLSEIISGAIKDKPKAVRQGFQISIHDPLYSAACDIKTKWMTERTITPEQADVFGVWDLYFHLRAGVSEDNIFPGMVIPGYSSDQDDKFKQN